MASLTYLLEEEKNPTPSCCIMPTYIVEAKMFHYFNMGTSYAVGKAALCFPLHQSYLSMLCNHISSCGWDAYDVFRLIAGIK